jgi:hypothetical protein
MLKDRIEIKGKKNIDWGKKTKKKILLKWIVLYEEYNNNLNIIKI